MAELEDAYNQAKVQWPKVDELTELDKKIVELSKKYQDEAIELIKELVRIPADHYDKDPLCGTSNHEGPRLEYLKKKIVELGAVEKPEDVRFDDFGSLVWTVTDSSDPIPLDKRLSIYLDGHTDTVYPLRDEWRKRLGEGIDCYNGLIDKDKVCEKAMQSELRHIPPKDKWDQLIFGRGTADQLQGVVSQVYATKILLETKEMGSLRGTVVVSVGTVAEEDNDGGAPMHIIRKQKLAPHQVPDCVIFTEGTGDLAPGKGPLGIYIGQRGRCQIQVEVVGVSSHGSMPTQGINPLEWGAKIIAEAADQAKDGFKPHAFLGKGTRTASWCLLDTPSDCAVPARFVFRFDRRVTRGETAESSIEELMQLKSIKEAEAAGCKINISIPIYDKKSWMGVPADNPQDYMGWLTPMTDPVVQSAYEAYKRCITPYIPEDTPKDNDHIPREPRVERWIFSTDGVGFPIKKEDAKARFSLEGKGWIEVGEYVHPPMFGIGAGFEHHCHKLGEYLHKDHVWAPTAVIARFPSLFVKARAAQKK
jgi:putative selenium metabolism hydrolase